MKIGISTTSLEPSLNHGVIDGIGVYTRQLLQGISKYGQNTTPYSFSAVGKKGGLEVGQPFSLSFGCAAGIAIASNGHFKANTQTDIFHFTDYRIIPVRCPSVATLYDAIPLARPEMARPHYRKLKNFVLRSVSQFADHIIAISQHAVPELVEHYGIEESRISVVPCGVDRSWLEPLDPSVVNSTLQRRRLAQGYFLFVGTLVPRKNIERIISAYMLLRSDVRRQHPLVIVGKAGQWCEKLVDSILRLQETDNIHWLNDVTSSEELRHLYAGAGVFTFPSLYEGFGLPVLEAFASGIPVVTSNTTSLPEVSNDIGLEVDPESVEDIAEAMETLIDNESERAWRIKAGLERARSMTWDKTIERTLAVYCKLV